MPEPPPGSRTIRLENGPAAGATAVMPADFAAVNVPVQLSGRPGIGMVRYVNSGRRTVWGCELWVMDESVGALPSR